MTFHASRGIEYRTKPEAGILSFFKYLLVADKSVPGGLGNAIAGALRTGALRLQGWRIEPSRCFGWALLSQRTNRNQTRT